VSGGKFLPDRAGLDSDAGGVDVGLGAASPTTIDDADSGALALGGVLEFVETVWPSLESAVQENTPSTASRLTVNAATA